MSTAARLRLLKVLTAVVLGLAVVSCGGGSQEEDVPFTSVGDLEGDLYGGWPVKNYVIRTQAELTTVWSEFELWRDARPPVPSLDLDQSALLGVSLGTGTICSQVRIVKITRADNVVTVDYTSQEEQTGSNPLCLPMLLPRLQFVLVAEPIGEVRFRRLEN